MCLQEYTVTQKKTYNQHQVKNHFLTRYVQAKFLGSGFGTSSPQVLAGESETYFKGKGIALA